MIEQEQVQGFVADLQEQVAGEVYTDRLHRAIYATDASLYEEWPVAVLLPKHREDIQAAVTLAGDYGIPVIPRGGGTSLAGQAIGSGLIIDCSRYMDAITVHEGAPPTVTVEPGVIYTRLQAALQATGWQVGPDPASGNRATLGGMTATNATGAHSIVYGMMVDHVQAVRAVLADGSEVRFSADTPVASRAAYPLLQRLQHFLKRMPIPSATGHPAGGGGAGDIGSNGSSRAGTRLSYSVGVRVHWVC